MKSKVSSLDIDNQRISVDHLMRSRVRCGPIQRSSEKLEKSSNKDYRGGNEHEEKGEHRMEVNLTTMIYYCGMII